jgi:hypothetical protein
VIALAYGLCAVGSVIALAVILLRRPAGTPTLTPPTPTTPAPAVGLPAGAAPELRLITGAAVQLAHRLDTVA